MTKIISLSNGHDSSITALLDGEIKGHWELERVLNIKHFCGVDMGDEITGVLLNHVLPQLGWTVDDLDYLVFAGCTEWKKTSFGGKVPAYNKYSAAMPYAGTAIDLPGRTRNFGKIQIYSIVHHVCHMAYAFYTSPFEDSLVFSWDGIGDGTSTMSGRGIMGKLKVDYIFSQKPPYGASNNGVGLTYSYLGRVFPFLRKKNGQEDLLGTAGKAMGLSSYGKPRDEWRLQVRHVLREWMPRPEQLIDMLQLSKKDLESPDSKVAQDLMATIQDELELYLCETIKVLLKESRTKNLCMAGGCALNVQANSRLLSEKIIDKLYVPPATSDCGVSIGAALYVWHNILLDHNFYGTPAPHYYNLGDHMYNAPPFWEPHFTRDYNQDDQNRDAFRKSFKEKYSSLTCKVFGHGEAIDLLAEDIAANKIVAWRQGQQEIGPRALGHSSIFANPNIPTMKDTINGKVKHREFWRPYAGCMLREDIATYFDCDPTSPALLYMLESPQAKRPAKTMMPAIIHADNTCRIQAVTEQINPQLYQLIKTFKEKTGVPALLLTSFNGPGQPIINDFNDAIKMLIETELDVLWVENWRFAK